MTVDPADSHAAVSTRRDWARRNPFFKLLGAGRKEPHGPLSSDDEVELITRSSLFDANWYRERYRVSADPVRHYVEQGARRGSQPHPLFDAVFYLGRINGLGGLANTPLGHFVVTAGRLQPTPTPLFDPDWYAAQYPAAARDEIAFRDYLLRGAVEGLWPHPLFDVDWYYEQEPGLAGAGINPLTHFVEVGAGQGLNPNRLFDVRWYREANTDLIGYGNPLAHFVTEGHEQGLRPSPLVDLDLYRREFPNVPEDNLAAFALLLTRDADAYLAGAGRKRKRAVANVQARPQSATTIPGPTQVILADEPASRMLADIAAARRVAEHGYQPGDTANRAAIALASGAESFRVMARDLPVQAAQQIHHIAAQYAPGGRPSGDNERRRRWQPYWCATDPTDSVVNAGLFERDAQNKLGPTDAILSMSGLSHERNPLGTLRRLSFLTTDYVLLYTPVVEAFCRLVAGERVAFTEHDMWPAQGMSAAQTQAIEDYWSERGVALQQFEKARFGSPWDLALKNGWPWFFGENAILWLAERSGLEPAETAAAADGRGRVYMLRRKRS